MRAVIVMSLLAVLFSGAAAAQTDTPKTAARGPDVTKEDYIQKATERAAKRFEKMDANKDGVLSAEERLAARPKKRSPKQTGSLAEDCR